MDSQEFLKLNSDEVRRDSSLMAFYIDLYFSTFNRRPSCVTCTFNSDFNRLKIALSGKNNVNLSVNKNKMENTFKLKKITGNILAFKKGKVTHRLYDNNLNNNFVVEFLTNGTEDEISERKKLFSKLPKLEEEKEEKEEKEIEEVAVKKTRKKRKVNE